MAIGDREPAVGSSPRAPLVRVSTFTSAQQVLENLLANAARHAATRVQVSTEADRDRLEIRVVDAGSWRPYVGELTYQGTAGGFLIQLPTSLMNATRVPEGFEDLP